MTTEQTERELERATTFKNVELFKNDVLGTGAYGAVFRAKCDELICAAKLLYPLLFEVQTGSPRDYRQPFRRFELECRLLSRISHPNIVQYLGMYRDPDTNAPVLLMELMDESLTHFLESSPGEIPYHIQVNLSYDIAQALAFLHANGITHRDLSSNNVLLLAGRAKITDFGMSKFADIVATHLATMTKCPGTPAFMPPEALNEPPTYTERIDVFSLGVLMVQIMTRIFPQPSERLVSKELIDPSSLKKKITAKVAVPEIERRYAEISIIPLTHPLLPIAQTCLRDIDSERPTSKELCGIFMCLKETGNYKESLSVEENRFQVQQDQLSSTEGQLEACQAEVKQLKETLTKKELELREKDLRLEDTVDRLEATTDQVQHLKQDRVIQDKQQQAYRIQLQEKETLITHLRQSLDEATIYRRPRRRLVSTPSIVSERRRVIPRALSLPDPQTSPRKLEWKGMPDCPINVQAGSSTVMDNKAYFQNRSGIIVEYDDTTHQWSLMPFHPLHLCSLVCIDHKLVTVGGYKSDTHCVSNKLYSINSYRWTKSFPPMPTKRASTIAVSTDTSLIVAGGQNRFQNPLRVIEVMDIESKEWYQASSLPLPCYEASAVVHKGSLYLTAGDGGYNHPTYSVLTCSLEALLVRPSRAESPTNETSEENRTLSQSEPSLWHGISNLPVQFATLASVNGHLLAIGGANPPKQNSAGNQPRGTQAAYEYNAEENLWCCIGTMSLARRRCLAAVLPGNKLIVVGGVLTSDKRSKSTEYAILDD